MSFPERHFVFDGTPCEAFDLVIYDIGDNDEEIDIASVASPVEETIGGRWRSYLYGINFENQQEISMTFGVNLKRLDSRKYLDRLEIDAISTWLTGHDTYKTLDIIQDDMTYVRYKVIVTSLKLIPYGTEVWAFRATFKCDNPYAYLQPITYEIDTTDEGSGELVIMNESSLNGFFYPVVTISGLDGDVTISNLSEPNNEEGTRAMRFYSVPIGTGDITVDCDRMLITTVNGINLYGVFNKTFLRLVRGVNRISVTGNCVVGVTCEYPVIMGG